MKLYELCLQVDNKDSYIDFERRYAPDIFKFFIMDVDSAVIKKELMAFAQSGLTENLLSNLDAVNATINIPIFSENFKIKVGEALSEDVIFYPCLINDKYKYYACKIKTKYQLIDYSKSEYLKLLDPDDKPILSSPVYLSNTSENFYIARDIMENTKFLVSELFKELIVKNNLNIKLKEIN
ncbi:hypothetical protein NKL93_001812 [Salmonella enterica]|nr:hypothetical protein [Salmonella enterica]EJO1931170.1 hypothetical protein [Salmonella enterica]